MNSRRPPSRIVTLALKTQDGRPWSLAVSADCLRFIGRYHRVDGFGIDAAVLFEGVGKTG